MRGLQLELSTLLLAKRMAVTESVESMDDCLLREKSLISAF